MAAIVQLPHKRTANDFRGTVEYGIALNDPPIVR